MTGKVKWFNAERGFGFILSGDGEDIFVHYTEIKMPGFRTLYEGQQVSFDLIHDAFGLQAINVVLLDRCFDA